MTNFDALISALREQVDVIAATALRYRNDGAERIYSTHPNLFPDTGFKSFSEAPTMSLVRDSKVTRVTEGRDALANGFADWQDIMSTGSDAIVNLPVRDKSGRAMGQLNLMGRAGSFSAETLTQLRDIATKYASAFEDPNTHEADSCA
jgi:hypothetical protein